MSVEIQNVLCVPSLMVLVGGKSASRIKYYMYEAKCLKCANSKYIGESDRNLYTHGSEHEKNKSGFIIKHQSEKHNAEPPEFKGKIFKTF